MFLNIRALISILCSLLLLIFLSSCGKNCAAKEFFRTEALMGTFVTIKAAPPETSGVSHKDSGRIIDSAFDKGKNIENKVSIFRPGSEINILNISKRLEVSADLKAILMESKRLGDITDGEFDITVAPILKREGFYSGMPDDLLRKIPDSIENVDYKNIKIDPNSDIVEILNGAWIDLSGIAKGYIADKIGEFLIQRGLSDVLVNAGGDIYLGNKDTGEPWKIGIREPGSDKVAIVLRLNGGGAVATSGDYENVIMDPGSGEMFSHIIDPGTDHPLKKKLYSVTVIAPSCAEADALATGMMAMGVKKAIELADTLKGIEAIIINKESGKQIIDQSKGADSYMIRR